MSTTVLIILFSYLLGCFTTGYYLVRTVNGQDIRAIASGNAGSRNVGRLLGAGGFLLTFLGDAGKGLLAVYLAYRLGGGQMLATAALLAVTAGHIWPLQLHFRGGKGFATFCGGLLLLYPQLLLLGLALCAVLYSLLRRTTRSGLVALAATPVLQVIVHLRGSLPLSGQEFGLYCLLVLVVLFAHRDNILQEFKTISIQE